MSLARRDITGAVEFSYLESFAGGDSQVVDEVLDLFREQSAIWGAMLSPDHEGWRDAVHTLKGAARGVGAFQLGDALDAALHDIAAYIHEGALRSLKSPGPAS